MNVSVLSIRDLGHTLRGSREYVRQKLNIKKK